MTSLEGTAANIRADIIKMIRDAGSGHPGGSLSATDIITTLFFDEMDIDNDRFILSKGHAAPALYAALVRRGIVEADTIDLRKFGSIFQGHPDKRFLPCVTSSSGSLGQGLSIGNGLAIGLRHSGKGRVYVLVGDGELQEGQIWEAAMTSYRYELDNLCLIIDNNGLQVDGYVKDVMPVEPLKDKWEAFNWNVILVDGHDMGSLQSAFKKAKQAKGIPSVIIAKTIKGKGVSFMEDQCSYHAGCTNEEQTCQALDEIGRCKE